MRKRKQDIVYQKLAYRLSEGNPFRIMEDVYSDGADKAAFHDMHFENEIGIMLSGKARRYYSEGQYDCVTGDAWTCGMWEPHGIRILEEPCRIIIIVVWPPFLANMHFPEAPSVSMLSAFTQEQKVFHFKDPVSRKSLIGLSNSLLAIASDMSPHATVRKRLLLSELILRLIESGRASHRHAKSPRPCKHYSLISPAMDLVFKSKAQITNVEAARHCSMGEDQFARTFDGVMGISFSEFARRHRVNGAANALASTDLPIKEIANEWGFTDQSHMHRLFQKYYSCPPNEYRKKRSG
ncbi:MAG: hypothetical protein A2X45_08145 [Lentisphaerae bacterium GWF2_50_93]|nr:MAG: hypothetical protein A2X45_08145 [Lentisphaerae bacterium GWF2_50_93]